MNAKDNEEEYFGGAGDSDSDSESNGPYMVIYMVWRSLLQNMYIYIYRKTPNAFSFLLFSLFFNVGEYDRETHGFGPYMFPEWASFDCSY